MSTAWRLQSVCLEWSALGLLQAPELWMENGALA